MLVRHVALWRCVARRRARHAGRGLDAYASQQAVRRGLSEGKKPLNLTGTFKARGLSLAMTMARSYGIKKIAVPSAGNAGGAAAAYAAAAGIEAHIFMPKDVPLANQVECLAYGAKMTLVDGLILTARALSPSERRLKAGSTYPR